MAFTEYNFDYTAEGAGALGAATMIPGLIGLVLGIIVMWKIFSKAGEAGWKSLIPFYNLYVSHEIVGMAPTWFILEVVFWVTEVILEILEELFSLPPEVALVIGSVIAAYTVLSEVIHIIKLCKCFGKGRGFAIGMILIPYVFSAIIAFDRSVYTMPANAHHGKEET